MKVTVRSSEVLQLEEHPPWVMYVASVGVCCVGLGVAWFFGGGILFFTLEIIAALYAGWTVLEDSEEIRFSAKDDTVAITRISPLGKRTTVTGKLSEIVSIRLDEQISQMWGKMTRISLLFESGLRLPLTNAFTRLPQNELIEAIDTFLESVAPQIAHDLYEGDLGPEDDENDKVTTPKQTTAQETKKDK